jgi:hypothetical protein
MNRNAKAFNKTLATEHIAKTIHHDQAGILPGWQG